MSLKYCMTSFPQTTGTPFAKLTTQDCVISRSSAAHDEKAEPNSNNMPWLRAQRLTEARLRIYNVNHLVAYYHWNITASVSFMTAVLSRTSSGRHLR